jgi:xylan 1,4-beta-xylosidase
MPKVTNPILPGFNPDPSILRVGDTYYIATSTFEWFPGVQIHASKDLANWDLVVRPLDRKAQLDMRGEPDSCGVWAPCLTHDGEKFWLVYTDMKRREGSYKDAHNYIVTADRIEGPWSDPVYANSSGFDPSLFHDDDGRKWFVNQVWDYRGPNRFAGIVLQEFDPKAGRLVGARKNIFRGTELALTEGPHLYKRTGKTGTWYYLITAEGGTGYKHAATMARSRKIDGPYEVHPIKHIITAKDAPDNPIQRAGHADFVETPDGRVYMVHLMSRPDANRRSVRGRETSIEEMEWRDDDWLWLKAGGCEPQRQVEVPGTFDEAGFWAEKRYAFDAGLPKDFQWLRTPEPERIFALVDGRLRLFGRESMGSYFEQALVARRQTTADYYAETEVAFAPYDERCLAGLTAYYGRFNNYFLAVTADADGARELTILAVETGYPEGNTTLPLDPPIKLPQQGNVRLAVEVKDGGLQFSYALPGGALQKVGPLLDATQLADECSGSNAHGNFTGAFVGMAAQDLNGTATPADFSYFVYRPLKS